MSTKDNPHVFDSGEYQKQLAILWEKTYEKQKERIAELEAENATLTRALDLAVGNGEDFQKYINMAKEESS